ncbi:MAG: TetR/AcrR family transcriptional regulator [Devosia sp.]
MSASRHSDLIDHEKMAEAARLAHPKMDRRTQRTRQSLHHALMELIMERGYDAISVADIADAANVGRSTFYLHYTDKDDLLRSGLGYLKVMLMHPAAIGGDASQLFHFSRFLTEHLKEQRKLYQVMMRTGAGLIIMDNIRLSLCEALRAELRTHSGVAPREIEVQFVVGAYLSVVTWWLDRGAKERPEEIDETFRRMAEGALLAARG